MTSRIHTLIHLTLLGLVLVPASPATAETTAALQRRCSQLLDDGERALLSLQGVEPAFANWRAAVHSCPTDRLDSLLVARLRSAQSLLPEDRSRAGELLDEAVALLDEENLDHADVLAGILGRRMLWNGEQGREEAVTADLTTIEQLRVARHGERSPEALRAHLDVLADRIRRAAEANQPRDLEAQVAEIERLLDDARSKGYLTKDVALLAHSEAQHAYELLGAASAAEGHASEISRLVHSAE